MVVSKIRIVSCEESNIALDLIEELKFEYKEEFENGFLAMNEKYSLLNENRYVTTLLFKKILNEYEVTIISAGASQSIIFRLNFGTEKRNNKKMLRLIAEKCKESGLAYNVDSEYFY